MKVVFENDRVSAARRMLDSKWLNSTTASRSRAANPIKQRTSKSSPGSRAANPHRPAR
jgi:hypothetical protein